MNDVLEDDVDVNAFAEDAVVAGMAGVHALKGWCPTADLPAAL